jgi:hypothetical protein
MIIQAVDSSRDNYSDYSLDGNVLTIGGVAVDLAEEESDHEVIISFGKCNGVVHRGLMPCCTYVAEVLIPPRRYETVEVEGSPTGAFSSNGNDGEEEDVLATHLETVSVSLDVDSVILKLWPVEHDRPEEANMAGGEGNAE